MQLLKKFPIFTLALSVFIISVLTLTQPIFASRQTHRLIAQSMPIIPAKIVFLTPQIPSQTIIKPSLSLNQISPTLASNWTTDHSNSPIRGCNCPQCQLTV
ncbi:MULTISPECIES: hypothetical protein [Planktothrix]|jgi:hypothetical protein|nr:MULTISPECIES: hypothetical protein [Planktothrix]MCB8761284.1 hypothetical protein [Planktothrix agardhii 1813]MCF3608150.1 hypothetical protein [Planktothrix agardhii 1033]CAD5915321.1 hypothetical protein NO108_00681 [Planktothrix rubescens]BBD54827.1 hypothetical protein NIES204_21230 [Planktothrix agardhii NIES-204]MBG0745572.1 hypothetical protein [Planktothrix agardhii KL2]